MSFLELSCVVLSCLELSLVVLSYSELPCAISSYLESPLSGLNSVNLSEVKCAAHMCILVPNGAKSLKLSKLLFDQKKSISIEAQNIPKEAKLQRWALVCPMCGNYSKKKSEIMKHYQKEHITFCHSNS